MRVVFVRPGRDGLHWLGEQVAEFKAQDALSPVTIVVPNYLAGRFAGRALAREHGWVNLQFIRLADLASAVLGGPATAQSVLNPSQALGAVRGALNSAGGELHLLAQHYHL